VRVDDPPPSSRARAPVVDMECRARGRRRTSRRDRSRAMSEDAANEVRVRTLATRDDRATTR
jgi:hypothetical protein